MNIPFPNLTPSLLDPSWFNPDCPVDEDAELTALERENKAWLNYIAQEYRKSKVLKPRPTPMEEADTDVEVAISSTVNDESDESEETHDEDEEEIVPSYSPTGNNDDAEQEEDEDTSDAETPNEGNQGGLWLGLPP